MAELPAGAASGTPFGALLRHYRQAAGLTQEDLAERAGISARNLRDLERGASQRPQRATVERLAAALVVPPAERAAFIAAARGQSVAAPRPATPSAGAAPPFVGRARELALIDRHLAGQGPPVLLLAGEPGMGKSRLLQAAAARALGQGLRVLAGGCQRQGGQMPYSPLLEALLRHLEGLHPPELRAALSGCAWLVRLLPELAGGPIEPLPAWTLPPEQERRLMAEAVKRLLTNVAGPGGVLLVLDDLQWASADALDLLATLARAAPAQPVRVVGAYRDTEALAGDPLFRALADLAQAGLAMQQQLGPLAPEEAAWLLEQLAPESPAPAARERVLARAGGVPFFLVSWAQTLEEESARGADGGAAPSDVPWTVAQGVRHRLTTLPHEVRELVGMAAVAGRVVPRALLAQVAKRSEQDLLTGLDAVCRARLLEEEGVHAYRFPHDVIREVVEGSLSTARRTLLHRRVAEALAAGPGVPPVEAVAYHYAHTEDHAAAAAWLERAGDRALAILAHGAALAQYRAAYDRATAGGLEPAVLSRLQEKQADLHMLRLDLKPAQRLFALARTRAGDAARRADLWRKEGFAQARLGDLGAALTAFEAAEREGGEGIMLPPLTRAAICIERVFAHYLLGDFAAAETDVLRAFALLRDEAPSPEIDRLLATAAWAHLVVRWVLGDVPGVRERAEQMLVYAGRIGAQQLIGRAVFGLGCCAWREAHLDAAEARFRTAQETLDRAGDAEYLVSCSWGLGSVALSRGNLDTAAAHFHQGRKLLNEAAYHPLDGLDELGRVACGRGDLVEAEEWFRRSLGLRERVGDPRGIAQAWTGLGMVARERGDVAGAARWCRQARRLAHRCHAYFTELDATLEHTRACLQAAAEGSAARSRLRLATALLARGHRMLAQRTIPEMAVQLALLDAELRLRQYAHDAARQIATEALRGTADRGLRRLEAQAHRLLGQCALADGDHAEAERQLRTALALVSELGFALDAAHTSPLLAGALKVRPT